MIAIRSVNAKKMWPMGLQCHGKEAATVLTEGQVVKGEHAVRVHLHLIHFPFAKDEITLVLQVKRIAQ